MATGHQARPGMSAICQGLPHTTPGGAGQVRLVRLRGPGVKHTGGDNNQHRQQQQYPTMQLGAVVVNCSTHESELQCFLH